MGALDVRILTQLFGGEQAAAALTPAWDGGLYYAAQKRSAVTEAEKSSTASLGLMYFSRWKNADSARSFARVYADELPRKYSRLKQLPADDKRADDEDSASNREEQAYTTNEGDVLIVLQGRSVFVSEGFNAALGRKLQAEIFGYQADGPIGIASSRPNGIPAPAGHELVLPIAAMMRSAGAIEH